MTRGTEAPRNFKMHFLYRFYAFCSKEILFSHSPKNSAQPIQTPPPLKQIVPYAADYKCTEMLSGCLCSVLNTTVVQYSYCLL